MHDPRREPQSVLTDEKKEPPKPIPDGGATSSQAVRHSKLRKQVAVNSGSTNSSNGSRNISSASTSGGSSSISISGSALFLSVISTPSLQ